MFPAALVAASLVAAALAGAAPPSQPFPWPERWMSDEAVFINSSLCHTTQSKDICWEKHFLPEHHSGKYYYDWPARKLRNDMVPTKWEKYLFNMSNILSPSGMHMIEWHTKQCFHWAYPASPPKPDWMLNKNEFIAVKNLSTPAIPEGVLVDEWVVLPHTIFHYRYDEEQNANHTPIQLTGPCMILTDNITCQQSWANFQVQTEPLPDYLFDVSGLHCHEGPPSMLRSRSPGSPEKPFDFDMKELMWTVLRHWGLLPGQSEPQYV